MVSSSGLTDTEHIGEQKFLVLRPSFVHAGCAVSPGWEENLVSHNLVPER